ncbi:MAG: hypothetical protein U0791_20015 [Gemmataceae bacterium]
MLLYEDHESFVTALAFTPDGSRLVSGTRAGSLVIRDSFGNATPLFPPGPKASGILNVAFLSADRLLVVHDSGWEILHETNGAWPLASRGEQPGLTAAAPLSASLLATGTGDRMGRASGLLRLQDLKLERTLQPTFLEAAGVRAIATNPANKLVAWSTADRELRIWDVKQQTPQKLQKKCSHVAGALALSPDGSTVAATQEWGVRVHDLKAKQECPELKGHKGIVSSVAFHPAGRFIATGSWDGTVRFWDPRTGSEAAAFQWPIGSVFSLVFAPDGLLAAAGGDRGAVVVWDVE